MAFNKNLEGRDGGTPSIMPACNVNFGTDFKPSQPKGDSPRPPFSGIVQISSGDARFIRRGELSTGPGPDVLTTTEPAEPTTIDPVIAEFLPVGYQPTNRDLTPAEMADLQNRIDRISGIYNRTIAPDPNNPDEMRAAREFDEAERAITPKKYVVTSRITHKPIREKSIAETVGTDPGNKIKEADARLRRDMRPVHSAKVIKARTGW